MQLTGFGVVLCPVDFSDLSAYALRRAAQLAACGNATLIAAYANWFDAPPYFTEARVEELKNEFRASVSEAERALASFVKTSLRDPAVPVETRVVEGLPVDAILKLAAEVHAGAIAMGTHGRSGYSRWMLGSVAERVLRESPVPVLTTRGGPDEAFRRILCPVDDSETSREALRVAASLATCWGASVTALHVHEPGDPNPITKLCDWIPQEERNRCEIRKLVRHGNPAAEILQAASERPFDLLVLGAPRRKFFEGMVLGTTTLRAVRHATCPVLTVGERSRR